MDAATYLFERQVLWAQRHGIALQGSENERGRLAYTCSLDDNLFQPLSDATRQDFLHGDGQELKGNPCRLQAVHSSAVVACNVFDYWRTMGDVVAIAQACRLPITDATSLRFEGQYPIASNVDRALFPRDPNIDITITYAPNRPVKVVGVECKFGEAYNQRGHPGLARRYLEIPSLWDGLTSCCALASRISPDDGEFLHLHPAQLLKHILGLKHAHGLAGFTLLYVWYDVFGDCGATHRREIGRFAEAALQDGINFRSITYQEIIINLARQRRAGHQAYVDYLADRYL